MKPSSGTIHCWAHTLTTVAAIEAHLFLEKRRKVLGYTYEHLRLFFAPEWSYPADVKDFRKTGDSVFSDTRETSSKEAGHLKCDMSELLCVYPGLRHFAETVVAGQDASVQLTAETASMLACFEIYDHLLARKRGMRVSEKDYTKAVSDYFSKHRSAYGETHIVPKIPLVVASVA